MMRIESRLAQIGSVKEPVTGAVSYPIYQATAFRHPKLGQSTGFDYARTKSPTRKVLEEAAAELESGDAGFACSSGMAALQTIFALFSQGDHLLVSLDLYGGTYRLIEQVMSRFGVTASYLDTNNIEALEANLRPGSTKAVLVETPTNPLMMITDLARVSEWAKSRGLLVIVDNTLLTPFFQRPLELGADIVIHSATKYLAGHNDVLAGLIVTKGKELSERMAFLHNSIGAVLGPQDSWLLMRGMKTLGARMAHAERGARRLAEWLAQHPKVEKVYYPGLAGHPGKDVHERQASGYGAIVSFDTGCGERTKKLLARVRIPIVAVSLGAVESILSYPAMMSHASMPPEVRRERGITDGLVRYSVGMEHIEDIITDLDQALADL